jgi:hypothetical protein
LTSDAKAAAAAFVQKSCTTSKALLISSKKCNGQPVGQEGSARLLATDAALDEAARFKAEEVNGGVPVHIDESFDKCNQHHRQAQQFNQHCH